MNGTLMPSPEHKMQGNPPAWDSYKFGEDGHETSDRELYKARSTGLQSLLSNPPADASMERNFLRAEDVDKYPAGKSPLANPLTPRTLKARFLSRRFLPRDEVSAKFRNQREERVEKKLFQDTDSDWDTSPKKDVLTPICPSSISLGPSARSHSAPKEVSCPAEDAKHLQAMLQTCISRLQELETEKLERYEKWKQEAVAHGMSMVEEERKRSDREHSVLLKRILFLTEELDEVNKQFENKAQECEELAAWAEQLSSRSSVSLGEPTPPPPPPPPPQVAAPTPRSSAWTQCGPTHWLASSAHCPGSPGRRFSSPRRTASPARCASPLGPRPAAAPTPAAALGAAAALHSHRHSFPPPPPAPAPPAASAAVAQTPRSAGYRYPWALVRPNPDTGSLELNPDLLMRATAPLESLLSRAAASVDSDVLAAARSSCQWLSAIGGGRLSGGGQ